jgi:hypothetical protein
MRFIVVMMRLGIGMLGFMMMRFTVIKAFLIRTRDESRQ